MARRWAFTGLLGILSVFLLVGFGSRDARASFGMLASCIGANDCGMGGAGIGMAKDASFGLVNPAVNALLGREFYYSPGWIVGNRHADTRGPLGNPVGEQKSQIHNFFDIAIGYNKPLGNDWAVGFAMSGVGGIGDKFQQSRTTVGAAGGFDREIFYGLVHMVVPVAWTPRPGLSVGVAPVLGIARFKADSLTAAGTATAGGLKWDYAFGGGFKVGVIWDINEHFTLGGTYNSRVWFQGFDNYRDLLSGRPVDTPANFQFGVVWHATPELDIAVDGRYIAYSHVQVIGQTPESGGFGWHDVRALLVGAQYKMSDKLTLRLGYTLNSSPIDTKNTFANTLLPAITRNKIAIGAAYDFSEKWEASIGLDHMWKRSQTETGGGDAVSALGAGTHLRSTFYAVRFGIRRHF